MPKATKGEAMSEEIKIEIPDAKRLMQLNDPDFAAHSLNALMQYEMHRNKIIFNMAARSPGGKPDLIITPLGEDKKQALLYSAEQEAFIAAGLGVKQEFAKTGKVSVPTRERFLVELTKDILRDFQGLPHASGEYQDLCSQVMDHVTSQLGSLASLTEEKSHYAHLFNDLNRGPVSYRKWPINKGRGPGR